MPVTVEVPESVDGVLGALGDGAIVIAGGTHVMPRLNTEAHDVSALVSLRRAGLAGIEVERSGGEASGATRSRSAPRPRSAPWAPTSASRSCGR